MRTAEIIRKTAETDISLKLSLDGSGSSNISTGCGFLDHMLTLFAKHGRFDLEIVCKGDTWVDDHHSVEDIGIALGQAFKAALGDKRGIIRYGSTILPMDESLILTAVDLSGRGYLGFELEIPTERLAPSTRSWWRNSSWGSSATRKQPCTSASWRAPIPTTSSRAPSNPLPGV